ncbi:putative short-subunit dehydrogenase-like oxidoreductase (DUF2520 family) [Desulfohalotomaculum tongense]|uniref:Rossmann-like and DUF2520 domain-containing protein n=1 Tax=Desulforadius tongensis TaxID=1216062 RepID=UPI001EE565A5|nr:Rossmann-like and DUF2520 domain-containing protein [Desulforadius tongensis]MBM7856032.1 putative short-subunit dehydrogenase-like oxidoreductase (DUF2520 family) [Desulforadius tongensis]
MSKPAVAVVGAGKVGSALAVVLQKAGYPIVGVASGSLKSARALGRRLGVRYSEHPAEITIQAQVVFITTPDREIKSAAAAIAAAGGFKKGQIVVHTSGSLPSVAIEVVKEYGAVPAVFHPLQSFADIETAVSNLPGSFFALEGEPPALEILQQMLADLQGRGITIKTGDKPLYHAAAVVASNYLVTIIHLATEMLGRLGMEQKQAVEALLPLIQGTLNNIKNKGTTAALTGPVERGDSVTLHNHLKALSVLGPVEQRVYKVLGALTVEIALQKGSISEQVAQNLIQTLEGNKDD